MQHLKQNILSILKEKGTAVPTSTIINYVSKDYAKLKAEGKYSKARYIHRRALYHLGKLVQESILKVDKFGQNGEKYFILNVAGGEQLGEISSTRYSQEIGKTTLLPSIPMEGHEKRGIIIKYGNLKEKLNSVVFMCDKYHEDLLPVIKKLLFIVDDCVCLENFSDRVTQKGTLSLLKELNKECTNCEKNISVSINLTDVNKEQLLELVKETFSLDKIHYIFGVDKISLKEKADLISFLLDLYAREKKTIFIKNKDRFDLPYFVGHAGVYSFDESEWNKMTDKPIFIACSQSTVLVDVKKFYDLYGFNLVRFKELLMNISNSFLAVNQIQRKVLRDYFKDNVPYYHRDFLELSRNYVRLWNFGLLEPELETENVLNIISKTKERVDEYTQVQDRIYNSCGMPIRFKIALNQASKQSGESLSSAKYRQMEIEGENSIADLKEAIEETSNVSEHFDGGIHVNFHRIGKAESSKDLLKEVSLLVNNHNLAFFSYEMGDLEYGK